MFIFFFIDVYYFLIFHFSSWIFESLFILVVRSQFKFVGNGSSEAGLRLQPDPDRVQVSRIRHRARKLVAPLRQKLLVEADGFPASGHHRQAAHPLHPQLQRHGESYPEQSRTFRRLADLVVGCRDSFDTSWRWKYQLMWMNCQARRGKVSSCGFFYKRSMIAERLNLSWEE